MLDYMRAEFYKAFHRRYTYLFLFIVLVCEALLVAGWAFTNANGNDIGFGAGALMLVNMLAVGLYCTVLTEDIVFSDQYKLNTLKNEVCYGLSRTRIYLGKLAVSCVTALLLCAVLVAAYIGMCAVVLPHDPAGDGKLLETVGYCLLAALPVWLGCQALAHLCFSLLRSNTVASFLMVGVVAAVPQVFKLLGLLVNDVFLALYDVMPTTPLESVYSMAGNVGFLGRCLAIGAGWFAASTLAGLFFFRRKEIN